MNAENPIKTAQKIIGENEPDDYIINPTQHAKDYEGKAPALSAILKSSDVQATESLKILTGNQMLFVAIFVVAGIHLQSRYRDW